MLFVFFVKIEAFFVVILNTIILSTVYLEKEGEGSILAQYLLVITIKNGVNQLGIG